MNNCNWCSVGEILEVAFLFCFVCFFVSFTHNWMNGFITCTKRGYVTRMLLFLVNYVLTANFSQKQTLTGFPNFLLWNSEKEIAFRESTGRELSFEWPQHRILSADWKVTFTLQISIKHSGSERVKSQLFFWVRDITKISSKSQQAALPITFFWMIFAGITLKKNFKKLGQHCLNPCSSLGLSLPSFATEDRKRFQCFKIV